MVSPLYILSTQSTVQYANSVFEELCQFPQFYEHGTIKHGRSEVYFTQFADGEIEASIRESIRNKDVFFFINSGNSYIEGDPAQTKMKIYHAIDAIMRSHPKRLVIVEPYCSPARSDRTMSRNSVGIWVHYKILISLGARYIISYQLHSDKIKTIIDPLKCEIEDIPAALQLKEYIATNYIKTIDYLESHVRKNWVFCSVDAGGENFAKKFATAFESSLITSYKQRNYSKANTVDSVKILTAANLTDKEVWVVDDLIDTGESVEVLLQSLAKHNVKSVNIAVVHPVFSPPALDRLGVLHKKGILNKLIVLDTVTHAPDYQKKYPFLRIVSSHRLSAQIIYSIHEKKSLAPFFEEFNVRSFLSQLPFRQL